MLSGGDALPSRRMTVRAAQIAVVAEVLRDPNPIHLDPAAAAAAGLGDRCINQGPANLAYVINMITSAFPDHRIVDLSSRYLANVREGDEVEASGVVVNRDESAITCDAWLDVMGAGRAVQVSARLTPC